MRAKLKLTILAAFLFSHIAVPAQTNSNRVFTSGYGVSVAAPATWPWDTEQTREAKVSLVELLTNLKADGKVRLLNTGPTATSSNGYARVRLSITTQPQLSQSETRDLTEQQLAELKQGAVSELTNTTMPAFKVDPKSIQVSKTRTETHHWAYRISYTRSGLSGGPVRVEQYYVPFSNRAVLLTLSHEIAHKDKFGPMLLRVWASLDLQDSTLWPHAKD